MTIHAYSLLYRGKASRTVGNMLHDAVFNIVVRLAKALKCDVSDLLE